MMPELPVSLESASLLSPAAVEVLNIGGPDAYARLVVRDGGSGDGKRLLSRLRPADVLNRPARGDSADALLSGLWLWHDWLDESHTLSQSIGSSTGSFWHAIMHRREGDFSNAKYWYARCGGHPAHQRFLQSAASLLTDPANKDVARQISQGRDGYGLVDLAEEAEDRPADDSARQVIVELQRLEWAALFEETLRSA